MKSDQEGGNRHLAKVGIVLVAASVVLMISDSYLAPVQRVRGIPGGTLLPDGVVAEFPAYFAFGLATAPAHIEDKLNDSWLDFARRGGVRAWKDQPIPEERLRFWTQPEVELDLAAQTGVKVFRLGIDWSRLCPDPPGALLPDGTKVGWGVQDYAALARYAEILTMIRERGMSPMVTLFHHSIPPWSIPEGGWTNPSTRKAFSAFAQDVVRVLGPLVDYWITFNEPNTFTLLTYIVGVWPPGLKNMDFTGLFDFGPFMGEYPRSLQNMTDAHNELYSRIKVLDPGAQVGIAHLVSENYAKTFAELPVVLASRYILMLNDFPDRVVENLDFLGINYYGEEVVEGDGIAFFPGREYSDSGRAVFPEGLYRVLLHFHKRYNLGFGARADNPIDIWVTESGIADDKDILRPSYIIEHLLAVYRAKERGVPVKGYIFWTVSDNWEWHDGYGPKFGLVAVDRWNNLARLPRPSYYLFQRIVETRRITAQDRDASWELVQTQAGKPRNLWRSPEGRHGLDQPRISVYSQTDWRFPEVPREIDNGYLQLLSGVP